MLPNPVAADLAVAETRIAALADPERCRRLDALEAVWKGLAYAGRPSWWDAEAPLRERAPCVVYPIARTAGQRLVSFVFGESRFPTLTVGNGGADLLGVPLTPDEAQALTQGVARLIRAAGLRLAMRQALEHGLMCGTAVPVCSLRAGRPHVELIPAKWCTPTFDPNDPERVTQLEVRYRYEGAPDARGRRPDCWYRRLITETEDRVWRDVVCDPEGREPAWEQWPSEATAIDFCPVVWARNLPQPGDCDDLDGVALHEGLEDEIECLDRALSQHHRNGLYNGEPQMLLTGASLSDLQGDSGRAAAEPKALKGWLATVVNAAGEQGGRGGNRVRKGAGTIWAVPKEGAKGELLESSGSGAQILAADAKTLRSLILEAMGVVIPDADKLGGSAGGESQEDLYAPMLALCDNLRECWAPVLVRVVGMLLRLLTTRAATAPDGRSAVYLEGVEQLTALARRFLRPVEGAGLRWFDPPFTLAWGAYLKPSPGQVQQALSAFVQAAGNKPVVALRTAVTYLAPLLGVQDVEGELEVLEPKPEAPLPHEISDAAPVIAAGDETAKAADAALNGAQIASLLAIVEKVNARIIPRDAGVQIIARSFLLSPAEANALLASAGHTPAPAQPPAAPELTYDG